MQKKMFKVISPVEKQGGGGQWWMRCGTAYLNKDDSINVYIDSLPLANLAKNDGLKLQLREYTEAELRERAEKRASYDARRGGSGTGGTSGAGGFSDAPFDIHGLPIHGRPSGRADEPARTNSVPF